MPTCFRIAAATTVFASALLASVPGAARELPEWEAGAGVGMLSLPDYRGSDRTAGYVVPLPFFVYRGKFLKADRDGVRGMLVDTDRFDITLSANGSLPVNSRDNEARRGMDSLRPAFEVGPTANVNLWRAADEKTKIDFRMPLRTAITIESHPKQIGWMFVPNLNLDVRDPAGLQGWNLGLASGILVNNRRYNQYFYSVPVKDATASRPAYTAAGGFAGSQLTAALSKRFPRYWVGAFLRYDSLRGAAFEDSPLVKRTNNVSAGVGISWVFAQSSTRVKADD